MSEFVGFVCIDDSKGRELFIRPEAIALIREDSPKVGMLQMVTGIEYELQMAAPAAADYIEECVADMRAKRARDEGDVQ